MSTDDRLNELEARVSQLEMMQELLMRLMSLTRPLSNMLEQFGATRTQEQELLKFLDELVERSRGPERNHPSKAHFQMHVGEILPALRGNRQFLQLLMDTLKVERPAYRELHEYMTIHGWIEQPSETST
jgi:hypothetical protein